MRHLQVTQKEKGNLTNFCKQRVQACGSILGLYRPLVASPKRTWPGLSSSKVRGLCPWGPGLLSETPRCQPGCGEEGAGRTVNVEGKGTSGNPAGKTHPNKRTLDLNNNNKKSKDPKTALWFYRRETEAQRDNGTCSGSLVAID